MNRRLAIKGIAGILLAASAPAIIPIERIMPVKIMPSNLVHTIPKDWMETLDWQKETMMQFSKIFSVEIDKSIINNGYHITYERAQ